MVNPHGYLEEGYLLTSTSRSLGGHDTSFNHDDSPDESDHDRDLQRDSENESDNDEDDEEVLATYPNISLIHAPPSHSGARIGSWEVASRKRSPTLLRASSVESFSDPKRQKVVKDVMSPLLGKTGLDESKFVKLGPAAWGMVKQVFHSSSPWSTKDCNAFMAKFL